MARAPDHPERVLFGSKEYMMSWAASNTYYAGLIAKESADLFVQEGFADSPYRDFVVPNTRTNAAIRSGIVNAGGYVDLNVGPGANRRASPNYNARDTGLTHLGQRPREKANAAIGWVGMGDYAFPGQAFAPTLNRKTGKFGPNALAQFINKREGLADTLMPPTSAYIKFMKNKQTPPSGLRYRNTGGGISDSTRGWKSTLTQSTGPQKGQGGQSYSSVDLVSAMYATKETMAGANPYNTDERLSGDKFSSNLEGYKALARHANSPNYISALGNMYKEDTTVTGDARRVKRKFL
jgi:hypothetical protein